VRSTLCIALVFVAVACSNAARSGAPAAGKDGGASSTAGGNSTTGSGGVAGQSGPGGTSGTGGATGTGGTTETGGTTGTGGTVRAGGGSATEAGAASAPQDAAAAGGAGGTTGAGGASGSGGTTGTAGSGGRGGATGGSGTGAAGAGGGAGSGGAGGTGRGGLDAGGSPKDAGREAGNDAISVADSAIDANRDTAREQYSVAPDAGSDGIPVPAGYVLAWSDEFDVDGAPNPKYWNFETGFVRNQELQWYQAKNASVAGGLLVIEARRERVANPNYSATGADWKTQRQYAEYTSSSMTTSGLQPPLLYGRFEMRARINTSAGMWPAFWTVGTSGEWPSGGEIDIMEYYNGNILANVAWGTSTRWVAKWDSSAKAVTSFGDAQWSSKFHVWRMDWDDQNIVLSVDDYQMNTTSLATAVNPDGTCPFKKSQYIIVNLAIGGVNGGDPSATTFPARYEIDYVRVFQQQGP
jgi:beta-glucanase (GH16 family)